MALSRPFRYMSESVEEDFQSFCMSQRFQTPLEGAARRSHSFCFYLREKARRGLYFVQRSRLTIFWFYHATTTRMTNVCMQGGRSGALEPSTVATCAKHAREVFFSSSSQQIPSNKTTTKLDLLLLLLLQHRTQTSILLLERSDLSKEIRIKCHEILQNSSLLISPKTTTTQARKQGCKQTSRAANFLPSFQQAKAENGVSNLRTEKAQTKQNKTKQKRRKVATRVPLQNRLCAGKRKKMIPPTDCYNEKQ